MPGPAAHLSIIELQTRRAAANTNLYGTVGSALRKHPKYAQFGSIGPDMLFWADWNKYTPLVNAIFDTYHTFDQAYDKLAAIWQPISDAVDKVTNSVTGGLAHSIDDTIAYAKGIINTAMLDLITNKIDYWQTLKPHFQYSSPKDPETNWNWLDFTHHRHTGKFAKRLIANAKFSGKGPLQAYAYGWLSHVTADVVGHAYVNTAVGGPWRTHFQRHHLQENFMDVWVWGYYHTPGTVMPGSVPAGGVLPFDYEDFSNLSTANLQDKIDLGDDLPDDLQGLIADTLKDVYMAVPHPATISFPGRTEINRAYQMQKLAFEIMTKKSRHLGPPKEPKVFGDMDLPTYPVAGGSGSSGGGGSGGGGGFSLSSLLESIFEFIAGTFEYLVDLSLWLISKITSPLTYGVRYGLYLIQLGLYEIFQAFHRALVLSAYVYPDASMLSDPLAQQFINPDPMRIFASPRREHPPEKDHSLFYPASPVEPTSTIPGPYGHAGLNYPYWFIEGEPTDLGIEKAFAAAKSPLETATAAEQLIGNASNAAPYHGGLGSAVDFFLRRAKEIHDSGGDSSSLDLPDWNIDADRGYGSKCWQAESSLESPPSSGVQLTYL